MIIISLYYLLVAWAMSDNTMVRVPEEVAYGFVCGLFLFVAFIKCTQPLGGK